MVMIQAVPSPSRREPRPLQQAHRLALAMVFRAADCTAESG
jgi:hypothetical protein